MTADGTLQNPCAFVARITIKTIFRSSETSLPILADQAIYTLGQRDPISDDRGVP